MSATSDQVKMLRQALASVEHQQPLNDKEIKMLRTIIEVYRGLLALKALGTFIIFIAGFVGGIWLGVKGFTKP